MRRREQRETEGEKERFTGKAPQNESKMKEKRRERRETTKRRIKDEMIVLYFALQISTSCIW